jgi:hypothetical protein
MYEKYRKYKAKYLEKKLELSNQTEFEQLSEEPVEVPQEPVPVPAEPVVPTQQAKKSTNNDPIVLKNGKVFQKYDFSRVLNKN